MATNVKALQYMRVSKLFLDVRVCTTASARHLDLTSFLSVKFRSFLSVLERKPEVASAVQSLRWENCDYYKSDLSMTLLSQLPCLRSLYCTISLSDVHHLHNHFARFQTLVELSLFLEPNVLPSPVVASFPTLRRLSIAFFGPKLPIPQQCPLDLAVPALEELVLPAPSPSWGSKLFPHTQHACTRAAQPAPR